ncbi:hypothetical protein OM960_13325 [Defluviimonas sp. CAU 1641]|uniref:Uncharacterized protein n=1 Tax=Defluviimonas salinarum TaxID=2992147 RepID=A0ABT3J4G2_9RHOB|nr:hypothetical protein [Defluviimonas salinarum]
MRTGQICEKKILMKKDNDHMTRGTTAKRFDAGAPGGAGALPETVVSALIGASDEIAASETWVAPRRGGVSGAVPRIMSVIMASNAMLRRDTAARSFVRSSCLRVLAYLPADLRLSALIDLANRNPEALDDIFSGSIPEEYEIFRFNILASLGVFARHGLIEEVFTRDRIEAVGKAVGDVKKKRTSGAGDK